MQLQRPRIQLAILTLAAAAAAYARTATSPLQEAIKGSLHLSDNQVALLQGPALAVPMILAAIPLGLIIDRYTRVRVIMTLALVNVIGGLFSVWASHFATLLAVRSLLGLTAPATAMTAMSVIADWYSPEQRGRANMVMAVGQVCGMSAAFALGGYLLSMVAADWREPLLWMQAPLVPVAALVFATREPQRRGSSLKNPTSTSNSILAFAALWRLRGVVAPVLVGQVMVGMADAAVLVWGAPTFSRSLGLTPAHIGTIMATALLVSGLVGPVLGGLLADKGQRTAGPRSTLTLLAALSILSIPSALFSVIAHAAVAGILLTAFLTIGYAIGVMAGTLLTVVVPNELRGLCLAISVTANLIFCLGLAPVSVSLLSNALGGPAMIGTALSIVCVVISVVGAVTFYLGRRVAT